VFTNKQVVTNRGKAGGVNIGNVTGYTCTFKTTRFGCSIVFGLMYLQDNKGLVAV
jgi:hypothetical protein